MLRCLAAAGWFRAALLVAMSVTAAPPLVAADVPEDLRRLVRADVGMCLEIHGLDRTTAALLDSPLVRRVRELSFYRQWLAGDDYRRLVHAREALEAAVGRPLLDFAGDVFGGSVVLAVYPKGTEEPSAVLLVRAADAESLGEALKAWNQSEEATTRTVEYAGMSYTRRVRTSEDETGQDDVQFYLHIGPLLALSDREPMIRQVIDLLNSTGTPERLDESERYRAARESVAAESAATLYFNPRAWEATLHEELSDPSEKEFAALWRRCESLMLGVRVDQGFIAEIVLRYDGSDMPAAWAASLDRTAGPAAFLQRVPHEALLVFAGRTDFAGFGRLASESASAADQAQWQNLRRVARGLLSGQDLFDDILPRLGPSWGAYLVPRAVLTEDGVPVDLLIAVELAPDEGRDADNVRPALENVLQTGFNLLATMQNLEGGDAVAVVQGRPVGDATLHWVADIGPWQPAFVVTREEVVLATSPETVEAHLRLPAEESLAASPRFSTWAAEFFPEAGQVLFLNAAGLQRFLSRHHDVLVEQAVAARRLPREDVSRRLGRFAELASVFDGVFVAARVDRDEVRLVVGGVIDGAEADAAP